MQHSTLKALTEMASTKTRKEIQPVYEASGKSFNGERTGQVLYDVLTSRLGTGKAGGKTPGIPLALRLRFLIVDGCGVNHCARDDLRKRLEALLLHPEVKALSGSAFSAYRLYIGRSPSNGVTCHSV